MLKNLKFRATAIDLGFVTMKVILKSMNVDGTHLRKTCRTRREEKGEVKTENEDRKYQSFKGYKEK